MYKVMTPLRVHLFNFPQGTCGNRNRNAAYSHGKCALVLRNVNARLAFAGAGNAIWFDLNSTL